MLDKLSSLIRQYCKSNDINYMEYAKRVGISAMEATAIASGLIKEDDLKLSTVNTILKFHNMSLGVVLNMGI